MLFKKRSELFGLDIGSSSVKLVELQKTGSGYQLVNFGLVSLSQEAIIDGALMDSQAVIDAIKALLGETRTRTKNVATSVSGHSVIIKKISVPLMTDEDLEESIQWEAEQYIPFNISDVNLDFQVLRRPEGEGSQMDVLLVAVKQEMIDDYVSVITDVSSFSIQNMYELNYSVVEDEVVAILNIGANIMNINVIKNGATIFTRDVSMGGNLFNEEIQKQLNMSYGDSESLKLGGQISQEVNASEVAEIISSTSQVLITEAERSLEFFSAASGDEKMHKIALCGGCAKLAGLAGSIEDQIGIPVEIANPFKEIEYNENDFNSDYLMEVGPMAGVGVGLAMRRIGDK
ncbi:type IV pilus biogenesis protein PilM [Thermodesulfobacteriota bacterium]